MRIKRNSRKSNRKIQKEKVINMKDPYILEDGTLKNLLGITDYAELKKAETDIGYVKLMNAEDEVIDKCDEKLLKKFISTYLKTFLNGQQNTEQYQYIKKKL